MLARKLSFLVQDNCRRPRVNAVKRRRTLGFVESLEERKLLAVLSMVSESGVGTWSFAELSDFGPGGFGTSVNLPSHLDSPANDFSQQEVANTGGTGLHMNAAVEMGREFFDANQSLHIATASYVGFSDGWYKGPFQGNSSASTQGTFAVTIAPEEGDAVGDPILVDVTVSGHVMGIEAGLQEVRVGDTLVIQLTTGNSTSVESATIDPYLSSDASVVTVTIARPPCTVADEITPHTTFPYNFAELSPSLQVAVPLFREAILAEPGNPTFTPTSGKRPDEYQAHLREQQSKFVELRNVPGIEAYKIGKRPQLRINQPKIEAYACKPLMNYVNNEIQLHKLVASKSSGNPAVRKEGSSKHRTGDAVDIDIKGVSFERIDEIARSVGLYRPYGANDDVHFEIFTASPPKQSATIIGNSPINLLLIDPQGRRLGFNPETGLAVNEIGDAAIYSGPGSEPQLLELPDGEVGVGAYQIAGIGTGEGPYTVYLDAYGEDGLLYSDVLSSGVAAENQPITTVVTDIVGLSTTFPGDSDGDGVVGLDDLNNVRNNFGGQGLGDVTFDGTVGLDDLNLVRNRFGADVMEDLDEPESISMLEEVAVTWTREQHHAAFNKYPRSADAVAWMALDEIANQNRELFQSNGGRLRRKPQDLKF